MNKELETIQDKFVSCGYYIKNEYIDFSRLTKSSLVNDCMEIAALGQFKIIHLDVKSNWKSIATELVLKNNAMCMVITVVNSKHSIFSIPIHHENKKTVAHVVIDSATKSKLSNEFFNGISVKPKEMDIDLPSKIKNTFEKFNWNSQAIVEFASNLDKAILLTRNSLDKAMKDNKKYKEKSAEFLEMCKTVINNRIEPVDIKEMLIQHILTYEIFSLIYDSQEFHKTNAVAQELDTLTKLLGISLGNMNIDYSQIKLVAETLEDATDRQEFLHDVYENFYEKYNPLKKKKDGIVYTPAEVVSFMVKSADELMEKHFGRCLSDDNVIILDPATGTGTFVASVLRHLKPESLERKYKNDLFANEISILPYYIAALNIENTYRELTRKSSEFENICWMDTLDIGTKNWGKLTTYFEKQDNVKRISRQQEKDICLVIGNPPYNAVQTNFNDTNAADKYPDIDKKITESYMKNAKVGNKNKQFDMYKRFLKWSSERIKGQGMVVFVSNNSFLGAKSDDGFRRSIFKEFDYIYTVDLKGNSRHVTGDDLRKQGENIFNIRVGVTISFFIKTGEGKSEIQYAEIEDYKKKKDKLDWLEDNSLSSLQLREIVPDKDANWLNQTNNDFDELVPIISKEENSLFGLISLGTSSNRDEWVYNIDNKTLCEKMKYFIGIYNKTYDKYENEKPRPTDEQLPGWVDKKIKWSTKMLNQFKRGNRPTYSDKKIHNTLYRPFVRKLQYFDKIITNDLNKFPILFKNSNPNKLIGFLNPSTNKLFSTLATDKIMDLHCIDDTQCIPFYIYDNDGECCSNITKFGLELFSRHYKNNNIIEEDIFYYTYAIFNDPKYAKKYKFNLQRKLPRIPLAPNFEKWVEIGKKLYNIHVGFESAEPYPLKRTDKKSNKNRTRLILESKNQNDKDSNPKLLKIIIDEETTLEGIPDEAIQYTFSSKSALGWILCYYKELKHTLTDKSCNDEKIRKKFNTYNFADHKEHVIDLLQRVTTVSVETMKLRKELENMPYGDQPKWNLENSDNKAPGKKKIKKIKTTISKNSKTKKTKIDPSQVRFDGIKQTQL